MAVPRGSPLMDEENKVPNETVAGCWLALALVGAIILMWFGSWGRHFAGWIFMLVGLVIGSWFGQRIAYPISHRPFIMIRYWFQFGLLRLDF